MQNESCADQRGLDTSADSRRWPAQLTIFVDLPPDRCRPANADSPRVRADARAQLLPAPRRSRDMIIGHELGHIRAGQVTWNQGTSDSNGHQFDNIVIAGSKID